MVRIESHLVDVIMISVTVVIKNLKMRDATSQCLNGFYILCGGRTLRAVTAPETRFSITGILGEYHPDHIDLQTVHFLRERF